jgi:hypothetical protein
MPKAFDYGSMANADPDRCAAATYGCVTRLHDYQPHEQAIAAALLFLQVCRVQGAEPQDVMVMTRNMVRDERNGTKVHFKALDLYVDNELNK